MALQNSHSYVILLTFLLLSSNLVFFSFSTPIPRRVLQDSTTAQQFLVPHNRIRAGLGLPPLQWSNSLASFADRWARQRRGDCALVHSDSEYGENIFWGGGRNWRAADAVAAWANEGKYYNYASNACRPNQDCSHYTQISWRRSAWLGCARVVCNSGDTFITCNYDPHGNVLGQRPF